MENIKAYNLLTLPGHLSSFPLFGFVLHNL